MKKLGKYEVLGELGHGAMGVVYRARDPIINRLVALKTITTGLADNPTLLQRFYKEAQSAGSLQHPNIVTIYDMGDEEKTPYIAMELIEGESLEQVIFRREIVHPVLKLTYALQACRAFDYAHKRGIVHRDIKPGNVMVSKDGIVKVVDFGIARVLDTSKTQTGMLIGTFAYMSPEQYHAEHADERSDIWSFGVLLYELFCYLRPFTGDNPATLMHSICSQEPPPLSQRTSDCPLELESIISRILQKSPQDRYQSMEDLLLDLEPVYRNLQARSISELINQTMQCIENDEFTRARELLRESWKIDPANTQARALLEKVNVELKRQQNRPKAQRHVDKGRALLEEKRIQEARAEAKNALALDSTFESARELERMVQQELDRGRMVAELLQASGHRLAEGRPSEAEALLAKVLEIEPANKEAKDLRKQALKEEADRQKHLRLLEKMQEARALWTRQNHQDSIALLNALRREFPDEEEIQRLLSAVREDAAEQYRQRSLEMVRSHRIANQYAECQQLLLELQRQFPNDDEISRLLVDVRLDEAKQGRLQGLAEARSLLAAGYYEQSIVLLMSLGREFPDDDEIGRLLETAHEDQAEYQRQQTIAEVRKLLSARRYDECNVLLTKLLEQFPHDREIAELLSAVREDQAEQRKLESLAKGRSLLAMRRYEESITLLVDLGKEFPDDDEIPRLLRTAREGQSDQRKLEGLAEAKSLLAARRYEDCISLLTQLEQQFPDEREIPRLLTSASEEQAEQQKRQKLAEARSLVAAERFGEAFTLLKTLSAKHPRDSAVQKLYMLVDSEFQKQAHFQKLRGELENLKGLLNEKKYSEILSREKELQNEFRGEVDLLRLIDFARIQQKQVESEAQLRKSIEDVKAYSAASRFVEAIEAAQVGLKRFPGNSELLYLCEQAEIQEKKQRARERMEQRVRQIRFKIKREEFSDAIDLAKDTLKTMGADTDVTQLLSSAQIEIDARQKKREEERTLATIRTLVVSGNLDEAARSLNKAIETQILETFDSRVQRVSQEIADAKSGMTATSVPHSQAVPPSFTKEYALHQGPPLQDIIPTSDVASVIESTAAAGEPVPSSPLPIPSEVVLSAPQGSSTQPLTTDGSGFTAPAQWTEPQSGSRIESSSSPLREHRTVAVPNRKRQGALLALAGLTFIALFWLRPFVVPANHEKVVIPVSEKQVPSVRPPINPIEAKQRDAIDAADKFVVANKLDAALQVLRQADALSGPLTSEIEKKIAEIEESMRDANLRDLRQREEVLWQEAMGRVAARSYPEAIKTLQQIVALPAGGLRREAAQSYVDQIIPQREMLDALVARAERTLKDGDFQSARQAAAQIQQKGGDPTKLFDQINQAEGERLSQLENQFNQLKQRDDDAAIQQLKAMEPILQPLTANGWLRSKEAQGYLSAIPAAIGDVQARLQSKVAEAAFQVTIQRCQRALGAVDVSGLVRCRSDLQPIVEASGAHAREAKTYLDNINRALADDAAIRATFQRTDQALSAKDRRGLEQSRSELQPITDGVGLHAREAKTYLDDVNSMLASLKQPPAPLAPIVAKPSRAEIESAVRATIGRYEQAFEQRNLGALRQVWPTLGDKQANELKETFANVSSEVVRVQIDSIQISDDGTKATANGFVSNDVTPKRGRATRRNEKATFQLENRAGGWQITEVR